MYEYKIKILEFLSLFEFSGKRIYQLKVESWNLNSTFKLDTTALTEPKKVQEKTFFPCTGGKKPFLV